MSSRFFSSIPALVLGLGMSACLQANGETCEIGSDCESGVCCTSASGVRGICAASRDERCPEPIDAGMEDAGPEQDAGPGGEDAGPQEDAATPEDAGPEDDAAAAVDASSDDAGTDASSPVDGGTDAATADAGDGGP